MESANLLLTQNDLLSAVNRLYGIGGEKIVLHRESGGRVYYIECPSGRKVFKLYRPIQTESAVQSTRILTYLDSRGFPVVRIIPALSGSRYVTLDIPETTSSGVFEGKCVGILFEFAPGRCIGFLHRWRDNSQPLIHPKTVELGRQLGHMHRLMENFCEPILRKGRERYIDDFLWLLRRDGYEESKLRDFAEYGDELWAAVETLPGGFCHGDMHTGNTVYHGGQFTWMDFDRATYSYPVIDVGWLADGSDFNVFDSGALDRSRRLFDELCKGYGTERTLTDGEKKAVFGCVAIIHYDLISSIVLHNNEHLRRPFIDEQHDWLMRWRELCGRIM